MWGRGPRGNNAACLALWWFSITSLTTKNQIGSFWCWFLGGWVCVCSRTLCVSPRSSPVRLKFLPLTRQPPQLFSVRGLRLYFPKLEPWVAWSVSPLVVPPGLSARECGTAQSATLPHSASHCLAQSPLHVAAHLFPSYQSGWMFLL